MAVTEAGLAAAETDVYTGGSTGWWTECRRNVDGSQEKIKADPFTSGCVTESRSV